MGFPGGSVVNNLPANAGDMGSIPGSGISPGEGNATHSSTVAWKIPMDRGAWQATVPGAIKSGIQVKQQPIALIIRIFLLIVISLKH